ncbi:sulfur oxidation c-type cytochrome SoxX [Pseudooceanicola nitratireducens]|uniref:sulfur oxidation c-type cytochrome SoxX n=1 Tax=Pseudooceanicola nitratireducens TaxID=517719 RepID=UPI001C9773E8|nr:sulfur oxidation c-type cytochrome SoxX [Pseudooceanicola nitratireducens]MBY6158576.1 sulfur oxidation c-type cytochrome SoxX [Pseudooceanicola nitratireducens]
MRHFTRTLAVLALTASPILTSPVLTGPAWAEEVAPADVVFDEYGAVAKSLTGVPGDPAKGAEVMASKKIGNCVACHAVAQLSETPFHGEVGPELSWTGEARSEAELRGILVNSKKTFEGTVMPAYYKTTGFIRPGEGFTKKPAQEPLPPLLSAQQIEDTIAFLMTLKDQ